MTDEKLIEKLSEIIHQAEEKLEVGHTLCIKYPENLLRIYFFPDDKARKLVVGSMPEHLRAVQIR